MCACTWTDVGSCESQMTSQTQAPRNKHKCEKRSNTKEITTNRKHTLSIPSISRALFVPLGGGGGATELRSSLPLAEEPGASDPRPRFLVAEAMEGLPEVARRCASMSFLRLAASSLFSSVSLRMRSCETQSSHLPRWLVNALRIHANTCAIAWAARRHDQCITPGASSSSGRSYAWQTSCCRRNTSEAPDARGSRSRHRASSTTDRGNEEIESRISRCKKLTCSSSPCNESCTRSRRLCRWDPWA
jgi:hypothetical protein